MKRLIMYFLVLILTTSCAVEQGDENIKVEKKVRSESVSEVTVDNKVETKTLLLEEQVSFEHGLIQGEIKQLLVKSEGAYLEIEIQNNTDHTYDVSGYPLSINNYMIEGHIYDELPAKGKKTLFLFFSLADLEHNNIRFINTLDGTLIFKPIDEAEKDEFTVEFKVKTKSDELDPEFAYQKNDVILEENGLLLIKLPAKKDEKGIFQIRFLAINETGKDIYFEGQEIHLNNNLEKAKFGQVLLTGKRAVSSMTFEKDVEKLNNIMFKVRVLNAEQNKEYFISTQAVVPYP